MACINAHSKLQLDIYDIELQTGVPAKFRFPLYEEMMWYAALHYANYLKRIIFIYHF